MKLKNILHTSKCTKSYTEMYTKLHRIKQTELNIANKDNN